MGVAERTARSRAENRPGHRPDSEPLVFSGVSAALRTRAAGPDLDPLDGAPCLHGVDVAVIPRWRASCIVSPRSLRPRPRV